MRQKWIDNAKGIAMLCVILGHVNSGRISEFIDLNFVYGFHLVVFFVLSGYTFRKKELSSDYVNAKFKRLMVPYFITCFAILVMDVWNSIFLDHNASIAVITAIVNKDLVRSFFGSGAYTTFGVIELGRIGAIWFLPAMFFAVIFFQILLQKTQNVKLLGLVSAGCALIGSISARFIWLPFSIQSGMMAVFLLWIGYAIREKMILENLKPWSYIVAFLISVAGIWLEYDSVSLVTANMADYVLSLVVALALCLVVYWLAIRMKHSRIICSIGEHSLIVLCTHLFALETMGRYFKKILDLFKLEGSIRTAALVACHILFAIGAMYLIVGFKSVYGKVHSKLLAHIEVPEQKRDIGIDVVKGILILAMLVGHFAIDEGLRKIIYSCHMVAFVLFSGYFYRKTGSVIKAIGHMSKTFLVPYSVFACAMMLKNLNLDSDISIFRSVFAGNVVFA